MTVSTDDFGSASPREIETAARAAFGRLPDVSNPTLEILVESVLEVVRARMAKAVTANAEKGEKAFAIFLLTSELRKTRTRLKAERVATDIGGQMLSGHLWITSPTLAAAGKLQLSADNIGSALDEIEAADLGTNAAVVVDFSTSKLYIYQAGVEKEDDKIVLSIGDEQPALMDIADALKTFARDFVVTPNCQTSSIKTWIDGGAYQPVKAAEKKVQELLCFYLRARFGENFKIDDEVSLRSGRVDVVVRRRISSGSWETQAAIELKVARSFSSTGRATASSALVKHLNRGYGQIKVYREELEAAEGWLVVYDMRLPSARSSNLFAPHEAAATSDGINLKNEPVYGTADDYRAACMAEPA